MRRNWGGIGVTGSNLVNDDHRKVWSLPCNGGNGAEIDVLVNSAGHGPRKQILELTDADWQMGMEVYFLSAIRPIRLVTPIMQAQKAGSIINISTAWAFEPSAMFPTSAVARAGLASFTKIYADTYAPDNIRINNVLPGWIDSLPATEERRAGVPDGPLREKRGDRGDGGLPGLGRGGLHHRPEPARRWRRDPQRLTPIAKAAPPRYPQGNTWGEHEPRIRLSGAGRPDHRHGPRPGRGLSGREVRLRRGRSRAWARTCRS